MSRTRRSAKDVVTTYAKELLNRTGDPDVVHKIHAVEVIAMRMGWNDLYNKLRYRKGQGTVSVPVEKPPWWVD